MFDHLNEQCFRFIGELLQSLKSTNQPEKVLSLCVDRLVRMYRCQTCAIVLIDPATEYLHIDNFHGLSLTFCNQFRRRIATAAVGRLLWTGTPVIVRDADKEQDLAAELRLEHPFQSCACTQISVDQQTLGYLYVDSSERNAFEERDIQILQVHADICGVALVKARLFEENLRLERLDRETGLEKYVPFLEKLRVNLQRAQEFKETFALLMLDVDNFKDIANTFGYNASRMLLKEMANAVKSHLRHVDAAGRYGFDEFILLLANTDLENALTVAHHLLTEIAGRSYSEHLIKTTVSIGVAAYPQNGLSAEDLLTSAKRALFEAQRHGRNTVHHFAREWYAKETL
jgi:diguanylate cyclase (GGDEF)-like protein